MAATFATLPQGILELILQRLGPEDQARGACVSTSIRQTVEPAQLHYFAGRGDADQVLRLLLKDNVRRSINSLHPYITRSYYHARTQQQETALAAAAAKGHDEVVRILLAARASPHVADSRGATPLMRAIEHGHATGVRLLLLAGGADNAVDDRGDSALMLAVKYMHTGTLDILDMLLNAGAGLEERDAGGDTVLTWICGRASDRRHHHLLDRLLAAIATSYCYTVDTPNRSGQTALMLCATQSEARGLARLLSAGADPNLVDNKGRTPLMHSMVSGSYNGQETMREPALKQLLVAGADPHKADRKGRTALMCAAANDFT